MNKFNKRWFWALVIIAVLPTVMKYIYRQYASLGSFNSPAIGIILGIIALGLLIWLSQSQGILRWLRWPFIWLKQCIGWLLFGYRLPGARWANWWENWRFFGRGNKGWLVNGQHRRLNLKTSFQSCLTIASTGAGKSTVFVMPNIFTLGRQNCSMFITDPSGEIYDQTSGYLHSKGFDIKVLNLMDLQASHQYNPLAAATSFTEISQLAHLLIKSSPATSNQGDNVFWEQGGETILRCVIQALKNNPDDKPVTLGRVFAILSQFDHYRSDGKPSQFDQFMLECTLNDPSTWNAYKAWLNAPEKIVSSFISTATTALNSLGDPDLARLLSKQDINFQQLRTRKTAIYLMVRQQDMSTFSFVLSCFYTQLFNALLHDLNASHLPVMGLLDEFGQCYVPDFDKIVTVGRKYKLGVWVFLQSIKQLEARYSQAQAKTILDGLRTEIYLSGMELEVAERLTRRLGRKRPSNQGGLRQLDANLLNPDELITMKDNEALLLYGNKRPFKFRILPFYKHWLFSQHAKRPPIPLPSISLRGEHDDG